MALVGVTGTAGDAVVIVVAAIALAACRPCAARLPDGETTACAGDACYRAHLGTNTNFDASERRCASLGGHLTTVRSEAEAALLERLVSGATRANVWIGLRKRRKQCSDAKKPQLGFEWVSEDEPTDYSNWFGPTAASCVQDLCAYAFKGVAWKTKECSSTRNVGFVCKYRYAGMCPPLDVLGAGRAVYATPFGATATSLSEVPPGSTATVTCAAAGSRSRPLTATCLDKGADGFGWSQDVFKCEGGDDLDAGVEVEEVGGRKPPEMSKPSVEGRGDGGTVFVDDPDDEDDDDDDDEVDDADTNDDMNGIKENGAGADEGDDALGGNYDRGGAGDDHYGHGDDDDDRVSSSSKNVAIIAVVTLVLVTVIVAVLLVLLLRFCNKQKSHSAAKHKATKIPAAKTEP